jgi:hypothetical protein
MPFNIRKKNSAPKSQIEKMKIEGFFGRNLFLPHCGNFFMLIKMKPHMHFDIRKNNYKTKIEIFHCYVHRFAVSIVDLYKVDIFKINWGTLYYKHFLKSTTICMGRIQFFLPTNCAQMCTFFLLIHLDVFFLVLQFFCDHAVQVLHTKDTPICRL